MITVWASKHPLRDDWVEAHVEGDQTIREIVGSAPVHAWVNGREVPAELIEWARIKDGTTLVVRPVPQDDNLVRNVLLVGVAIAAGAVSGGAIFGLSGFAAAAAGAGVAIGGNLLVNALIPPQRPTGDGASQSFNRLEALTGASNQVAAFEPIPRQYGTFRFFPPIPMTAQPYTEINGSDQWLRMKLVLGYGPLDIGGQEVGVGRSKLTGGTVEVQEKFDSDADWNSGTLTNVEVSGGRVFLDQSVNSSGTWESPAIDLSSIDSYQDSSITWETPALQEGGVKVEVQLSSGAPWREVAYGDPVFGGFEPGDSLENFFDVHVRITFTTTFEDPGVSKLTLTANGLQFPVYSQAPIKIGDTDIHNFDDLEYEIGRPDQMTLYTNQIIEAQPGWTTSADKDGIAADASPQWLVDGDSATRTTDTGATEISVDLAGALFNVSSKGRTDESRIEWKIEYRAAGTSDAWTVVADPWVIASSRRETIRRGRKWSVAEGQYDVRLTRLRTFHENFEVARDEVAWTALRTIRGGQRAFDVDGIVVMDLRIRATEQLNGRLDDLSIRSTSILEVWNGSSWVEQATNNPAWIYTDIWTGTANRRPEPKSSMDVDEMLTWANEADNDGREYNGIFDSSGTTLERVQEVASAGRASWSITEDGKISVVRDQEQPTPKMVVSPRNSFGFSYEVAAVEIPHALRVRFVDDQTWENTERFVFDDGFSEDGSEPGTVAATVYETLEAPGVTDPDQAWRHGRYHLAQQRLRPERYGFQQDVQHLRYRRGDRVDYAGDVILVGIAWGRIKSVTTDGNGDVTELVSDEFLTMADAGKNYGLQINRDDGTIVVVGVQTVTPGDTSVTLDSATSDIKPGDHFHFGETGKISIPLKISAIEPQGDFIARMQCVPAAENILDAETGAIPSFDPVITEPVDPDRIPLPIPTIESIQSDEEVLLRDTDGSLRTRMVVESTVNQFPGWDGSRQIRYRESRFADWILLDPSRQGAQSIFDVDEGVSYRVQVRSVRGSRTSPWSIGQQHTVVGKSAPPDDVTGLTLTLTRQGIEANWSENTDVDLSHYVLQRGTTWDAQADTLVSRTTQHVIPVAGVGTEWVMVKAVDTSGNESDNEVSQDIFVSAPGQPGGMSFDSGEDQLQQLESGELIAGLRVAISRSTSNFVSRYEVQWKLSSASAWDDSALIEDDSAGVEYRIAPVASGKDYDVRVRTIDSFGLQSSWLTNTGITVVGKSAPPNDVPGFSASAARDRINLKWSPAGNPDISHYEIREGADWANGTLVAQVSATEFQTPGVSNGPWQIKAVDTSGNFSNNASEATISVTVATVDSVSANVIDNNVLLRWKWTIGTFDLATFRVLRGSTLVEAEEIGTSDTTFSNIFESESGTFTYWVVPVDKAGNEGNAESITLTVDEPPDFIFTGDFQTDWEGVVRTDLEPIATSPAPAKLSTVDKTALEFDGVDDYVEIPDHATLNPTSAITLEAWVYPFVDQNDFDRIIHKGNDNTSYWLGYEGTNGGRLRFQTAGAAAVNMTVTQLQLNGRWHHIAATYDGSTAILYVDGEQVDSQSATGDIGTNAEPLSLGRRSDGAGGTNWTGRISETRVWSVARTQTQIQDWMDKTLGGDETGLEGYWRMQRGSTETLPDRSGNSNDGTINGASWYTPEVKAVAPFADHSRDDLVALGYNSRDDMIAAGFDYRAQPVPASGVIEEAYDAGAVIASTKISVTLNNMAVVGSPGTQVTISTKENLGDAWTDNAAGQSEVFASSFRYVKVKVEYTSSDQKEFLKAQDIRTVLSSKIRNDAGSVNVTANPTTVNFNVDFIDVTAIAATPQGTSARYAVVDFSDVANPTSFDLYLFDVNGNAVTGTVRWEARGF